MHVRVAVAVELVRTRGHRDGVRLGVERPTVGDALVGEVGRVLDGLAVLHELALEGVEGGRILDRRDEDVPRRGVGLVEDGLEVILAGVLELELDGFGKCLVGHDREEFVGVGAERGAERALPRQEVRAVDVLVFDHGGFVVCHWIVEEVLPLKDLEVFPWNERYK